jgi:exo-1,4-beta-D-glucosaminidase
VTISNTGTGKIPAFMLDAHVVDASGKPVLPIQWSDNAISLWPGESKTLTATYRATDLSGAASVRVSGWNTATLTVPTTGSGPVVYQAEDATISQGAAESNHDGYTGTGFVNYDYLTGSYVEWTVNAPVAGPVTLELRYANGTTVNRPMSITVNGGAAVTRDFNATGNWDTWQTSTLTVTLAQGVNKIRATATTANGGPNVDRISIG